MSYETRRSKELATELASAYLDDEASPSERAEVEGDEMLMARVEQLRAVRDRVADSVAAPLSEQRDRQIQVALESVSVPQSRRELRHLDTRPRQPQRLMALAAAVVIVAAAVGAVLLTNLTRDDSSTTTAVTEAVSSDASSAAESADSDSGGDESFSSDSVAAASAESAEADPAARSDSSEASTETLEEADEMVAMAADDSAAMAEELQSDSTESSADMAAATASDTADEETKPQTDEAVGASDSDHLVNLGLVNLGAFDDIDSLVVGLAERRVMPSATSEPAADASAENRDDDASNDMSEELQDSAASGPCDAALLQGVIELGIETLQAFTATIGAEFPLTVGARLGRDLQDRLLLVFASPPDCQISSRHLNDPALLTSDN